ncbi:hypothetical protein HLRTI_002899 [Halorhabdus tiamatea SARL4B]|uniref:Uncharacterized protein n=1 Tax=Halorhabdus tiamatea SARL4B TaxID=1033806 RepID=U2F438_9EURY|nr:hypothetical protein [Halorhabdus tiamatea]ERJ05100.1 hypothetical protein HLRTI_002899 [Halorhabdus tiamatea SARL4B]
MQSQPSNAEVAAKGVDVTNVDIEDSVPASTFIDWSSIEIDEVDPCDDDTAEFLAKGTIMADVPCIDAENIETQSLSMTVHLETSNGSAFATGGTIELV